ncbi:MAG: ligase-associated DNA damage response exonuclease [Phycisphaeraceae bacterium]
MAGDRNTAKPQTLALTDKGLYCPAGDFYIDPWRPVERAVITHAHADHARPGSKRYLCSTPGKPVLAHRMQKDARIDTLDYGQAQTLGDATVTLHPAGHLLGSAQICVDVKGHRTVVTGDYKVQADPTCAAFEPIRCDEFITESTFALPIYRWQDGASVVAAINRWWRENAERGLNSVVFVYALGKAQRLLAGLDASIGPILLHGAVNGMTEVYRESGVALPPSEYATVEACKTHKGRAMVLAPPSANGSVWMKKLRPCATAMASGWMAVRGRRRFRAVDRGFVMSDHADWPGLLDTIEATGATRVGCAHGYTDELTRHLTEQGLDGYALETRYQSDDDEAA